jgi:hypothetical protein
LREKKMEVSKRGHVRLPMSMHAFLGTLIASETISVKREDIGAK